MSKKFEGYLPANAFVMGRKGDPKKAAQTNSASTQPEPSQFSFGEGDPQSPLIFVGGIGGTGDSTTLLNKMIEAMGKKRAQVYITPVLNPADATRCIQVLKPKVIVALGKPAAQNFAQAQLGPATKLIATYHPDEMVSNPSAKKECWEQLKIAMSALGWKK